MVNMLRDLLRKRPSKDAFLKAQRVELDNLWVAYNRADSNRKEWRASALAEAERSSKRAGWIFELQTALAKAHRERDGQMDCARDLERQLRAADARLDTIRAILDEMDMDERCKEVQEPISCGWKRSLMGVHHVITHDDAERGR